MLDRHVYCRNFRANRVTASSGRCALPNDLITRYFYYIRDETNQEPGSKYMTTNYPRSIRRWPSSSSEYVTDYPIRAHMRRAAGWESTGGNWTNLELSESFESPKSESHHDVVKRKSWASLIWRKINKLSKRFS